MSQKFKISITQPSGEVVNIECNHFAAVTMDIAEGEESPGSTVLVSSKSIEERLCCGAIHTLGQHLQDSTVFGWKVVGKAIQTSLGKAMEIVLGMPKEQSGITE